MQNLKSFLLLTTILFPFSAFAEYTLKDKSEIVGVWIVESTAPKLDGNRRPATQEMEFREDGSYLSSAVDFRTGSYSGFTATSTYQVENGIIKVEKPGRPGKYDRFKVYEKEDSKMILKGGTEGFYFLRKK